MAPRSTLSFLTTTLLFVALIAPAGAATTPLFDAAITWQAATVVPPWYTGKILPNFNTPITTSVLMTVGNQLADMRNYTISWKVNSDTVATGQGLARLIINPETTTATKLRIQAFIKNEAGETVANPIVTVERISPRVVIDSPTPQKQVFGDPVTLNALPFFFSLTNLSNLVTNWLVDGVSVSNEQSLTVAATENALPTVRVEAQVESTSDALESARQAITLLPTL